MGRPAGIAVVLLLIAGGALWWWKHQHVQPAPAAPHAPVAVAPPPAPPPAPAAPAIRHPIPAEHSPGELPSLDESDHYIRNALTELLGRRAVSTFLRLEGAARRFVATATNLATDDASSSLWPVATTPGHFETEARDGGVVIAASNAERYAPFVRFAEAIDAGRAARLYFRLYPLLQRAYEDLGYPGKYLNDRIVEVIDNLLATPKVTGPIRVRRVGADGGATGTGLYLYEDATLESASAGQKILLRVGTDNASRLMAKLTELRAQIAAGPAAARPR
jgi:Protein of unknown function (DUF3014)